MLSKELKESLYIQVEQIYAVTKPELKEAEIMERIEVFAMALSFASYSKEDSVKRIENDITDLLERIRISAKQEISKKEVNLLEAYLRLLCFLIDEDGYNKRKIYLAPLSKIYSHNTIDVLNTMGHPERADYYDIMKRQDDTDRVTVPFLYSDPRHPEKNERLIDDKEIFPFIEIYCFRNAVIHEQPIPLNEEEKWLHFICMFYTMIETTYKQKEKIVPLFVKREIDCKKYIKQIIQDYELKLGKNFKYIPLNVKIFENDMLYELEKRYKDSNENFTFEKINEDLNSNEIILNNDIIFNKAKLIGVAGMGKTTAIENIIYKEALKLKDNAYEGKIPVMIEMITVSDKEDTLDKLIAKKLNTKNLLVIQELIKRNMINLYIDGINEILIPNNNGKREYLNKIEEFVIINKNLKIVITDRDNNENSILNDYPTFILTGVTRENIEEFIDGNSIKPEIVKEKILRRIDEKPSVLDLLKNPFMLKNIISIVECNKEIPEFEDDIAEEFLKAIVERERVIKRDYKAPHILRLLIYVVGKYAEKNNENNMIISYFDLMNLFNEYCDKYKRNDRFDNDEMLDLIIKLGILKQVGTEKYTFVDDRYYNFFYYSASELL